MADLTPSQTVGPYFAIRIPAPGWTAPFGAAPVGRRIRIEGRVLDGDGAPVPDALLETWQPNAAGDFATTPTAQPPGLGRVVVNAAGEWAIDTIMPGPVPGPDGSTQAPHVVMGVFARGLLVRLVTRIYFAGVGDLERDPVLGLIPVGRRETVIARPSGDDRYRFDVVLQGPAETVFFAI